MNLLCISKGPMFDYLQSPWNIKFGEVYQGIGEINNCHGKYYILSQEPEVGYAEEHFTILPDDEEIEAAELDAELAEVMTELQTA